MRSFFKVLIALLPILPAAAIAVACSSSNDSSSDDAGVLLCTSNATCPTTTVCAYNVANGCGAQGECRAPAANPPAFSACGCDRQPVSYVTSGYAASPVESSGPCVEDAGSTEDAGADSGNDSSVAEGGAEAGATSEAGTDGGAESDSGESDAGDASDGA